MNIKNLLLTFLITLATCSLNAAERSIEELKSIARSVLQTVSMSKGNSVGKQTVTEIFSNDHIIMFSNNTERCVILARDNTFEPVLGYTDQHFDAASMHHNMKWWIDNTTAAMTATTSAQYERMAVPSNLPSAVSSFITTHWAQGAPYNLLCPSYTSNGQTRYYPSGCLATAMAQVMNYYEHPAAGTGKCTYQFNPGNGTLNIISLQLENYPFVWIDMLDNYFSGQYSEQQANAVATLMQVCGASVEMEYTESGSGAMMYSACKALRRNFSYDAGLPYFDTRFNTPEENSLNIYGALSQRIPVLFGGVSADGGHAFVLDGYDTNGLVHVNWGWGKNGGDGYFDLSYMNGFKDQQQYIPVTHSGIYPTKTSAFALYEGGLYLNKVDDTHISIQTGLPLNVDCETYTGNLYFVARNQTTGTDHLLATQKLTSSVQTYYFATETNISKPFVTIKNKIGDGTYRVFMASKSESETNYSPARTTNQYTNSYSMTVENGIITALSPNNDNAWMATTTAIHQTPCTTTTDNNSISYNMAGQKVSSTYKGIIIQNGKKIIKR